MNELSIQYPYSQLIHLLRSRAAQDLEYPNKALLLQLSAVYASDRAVLKWVMTATRSKKIEVPTLKPVEVVLPIPVAKKESALSDKPLVVSPAKSASVISLTGDALRDDIYLQLEKLKKSKHDFEVSIEEFQKSSQGEGESRKKSKQTKEGGDPLLEEIKSSKKKIKLDNPKQKEQNEIIDQFIKTQPVIPKAKPTAPASDLSEDSSVFSDNIVSETLVTILLKQGKKDKAIEVLKKLIWKFPQKKAYFAAQIEGLKS